MKNSIREVDWRMAPIMSHADVAAELRRRGLDITTNDVWYWERKALAKLREALLDYEDGL